LLSYLFCSHKYHNIENYFIFEQIKKRIEAILLRIVTKLSKICVWDLNLVLKSLDPDLNPHWCKMFDLDLDPH